MFSLFFTRTAFCILIPLQLLFVLAQNAGLSAVNPLYILFILTSIACFIVMLSSFIISERNPVILLSFVLYIFLNFIILFIAFYHRDLQGYRGSELKSSLEIIIPVVIYNFGYVSLFYLVNQIGVKSLKAILLSFWLAISIIILLLSYSNGFQITLYAYSGSPYVDYLRVADLYVILSILLVSLFWDDNRYFILSFVSIICLFCLKSRTSLFLFILSISYLLFFSEGLKIRTAFIFVIILLLYLIFSEHGTIIFNVVQESRFVSFFSSSDSSSNARDLLNDYGIQDIIDNPITGNFGGQNTSDIDKDGARWGAYMHNILSYWRQFSVLSILILFALFFISALSTFKLMICKINNPEVFSSILLFIYLCTAMFFSRSYAFSYIFIGIFTPVFCLISTTKNEKN